MNLFMNLPDSSLDATRWSMYDHKTLRNTAEALHWVARISQPSLFHKLMTHLPNIRLCSKLKHSNIV